MKIRMYVSAEGSITLLTYGHDNNQLPVISHLYEDDSKDNRQTWRYRITNNERKHSNVCVI